VILHDFWPLLPKRRNRAVCGKGGLQGTNENVLVDLFSLNTDMPLTSTKSQPLMLITRNIKLSKLKIISSPSTRYYTIL